MPNWVANRFTINMENKPWIWVNSNISLTWIVRPWMVMIPFLIMIPGLGENRVRSWWNLPRNISRSRPTGISRAKYPHIPSHHYTKQVDILWKCCAMSMSYFPEIHVMWLKQCHRLPMTGNGKHTTYKNGDDWGMVYYCFNHISIS